MYSQAEIDSVEYELEWYSDTFKGICQLYDWDKEMVYDDYEFGDGYGIWW